MADATELLPCPFCGGKDIDPAFWATADYSGPGCSDCGSTAENPEKWNTRAAPKQLSAVAAELTPEQVFLINDMIHAWIDPEKKGEFRQAFRNDCKRLLATAARPSAASSSAGTAETCICGVPGCDKIKPNAVGGVARPSAASTSAGTVEPKCLRCGYELKEHSYNGACYGICGKFVMTALDTCDHGLMFSRCPECCPLPRSSADIVERLRKNPNLPNAVRPLCKEAADEIEHLRALPQTTAHPDVEARIAVLSDALKSISKNTCCDNCQEAARVARSALRAYVRFARTAEGGNR